MLFIVLFSICLLDVTFCADQSRNGCRLFHRSGIAISESFIPNPKKGERKHLGIDYSTKGESYEQYGVADDGTVVDVGKDSKGNSKCIVKYESLKHCGYYLHGIYKLKKGDKVDRETVVGLTSNVGPPFGNQPMKTHLHFEWHPLEHCTDWKGAEDFEKFTGFGDIRDWCDGGQHTTSTKSETSEKPWYRVHTKGSKSPWLQKVNISDKNKFAGDLEQPFDAFQVSGGVGYQARKLGGEWWENATGTSDSIDSCGKNCAGSFKKSTKIESIRIDKYQFQVHTVGSKKKDWSEWATSDDGKFKNWKGKALDGIRIRRKDDGDL